MKMEFIETGRGGKKLCFSGFIYTKKAVKTNRVRWECSHRKTLECKVAMTTSLMVSTNILQYYIKVLLN